MQCPQYGKRQKKQTPKTLNTINLGVATYVVQFDDKERHRGKLVTETGGNNAFESSGIYGSTQISGISGSTQNSSHVTNRQRDHHNHKTLYEGHFLEAPPSSGIVNNKIKQQNHPFSTNSHNAAQALPKPLSPVGSACEQARHSFGGSPTLLPRTRVYLPGERVIFSESPSAPGIPIVYRLEDERKSNPDKLNLDRRKLSVCPILEGEGDLRLLNFQHNLIVKIQRLTMMKKLIFLDFYDNHINEISGLSALRSLRVLMLGKNRIREIDNLFELPFLDVLDLHGNKITNVKNVSHLHQLRVLNLAGNELTTVNNLTGLTALSELNLRRNKIHTLLEIDQLPSLKRLFLSFNDIKKFDDISCLANSTSLIELSLDGNPICTESSYRQTILQLIPLRQLDMKKLTDDEKRMAHVMAKKEEEKKKEAERLISVKEKRRLAISNAQRKWSKQFYKGKTYGMATCKESEEVSGFRSSSSLSSKVSSSSLKIKAELSDYNCHLAELVGNSLDLYGPGSLDAIDKNWGEKTANGVLSITFKFINFSDIVPVFKKLNNRFPSLQSLHFELTNISTLNDVNAFVLLARLDHLNIVSDGNPITKLSLWKPYTIYRLTQLNMKTLNGSEITDSDVVHAEKTFGELSHLTTTHLSQWRLFTLFAQQKEEKQTNIQDHKNRENSSRSPSTESVSKAGLFYRSSRQNDVTESAERDSFSKNYFQEILQDYIMIDRKQIYFEKVWPQMLKEMINKYCVQITDMDSYCKQSLEKIKRSVHVT